MTRIYDTLNSAQNLNASVLTMPDCEPPQSVSQQLQRRVELLRDILGETTIHLAAVSNHLFGPSELRVSGQGRAKQNTPPGFVNELCEALDNLIETASSTQSEARSLNQRI